MNNNYLESLLETRFVNVTELNQLSSNSYLPELSSKVQKIFENTLLTPEIESVGDVGLIGSFFANNFKSVYYFFCEDASKKMVKKIIDDYLTARQSKFTELNKSLDTYKIGQNFSPWLSGAAIQGAIDQTKQFADANGQKIEALSKELKDRLIIQFRGNLKNDAVDCEQVLATKESWIRFHENVKKEDEARNDRFRAPFEEIFKNLTPEELQQWKWAGAVEQDVIDFLKKVQTLRNEKLAEMKSRYSEALFALLAGIYASDGKNFKHRDNDVETILKEIKERHKNPKVSAKVDDISDTLYALKVKPSLETKRQVEKAIGFLNYAHTAGICVVTDGEKINTIIARHESLQEKLLVYIHPLMRVEANCLALQGRQRALNLFLEQYQPPVIQAAEEKEVEGNTIPNYVLRPRNLIGLFPLEKKASLVRAISDKFSLFDRDFGRKSGDIITQALNYYQKKEIPEVKNVPFINIHWSDFFSDLPLIAEQVKIELPDLKEEFFQDPRSWGVLIFAKFLLDPENMIKRIPAFINKMNECPPPKEELQEFIDTLDNPFLSKLLSLVDTVSFAGGLIEMGIKGLIKPFLSPRPLVKDTKALEKKLKEMQDQHKASLQELKDDPEIEYIKEDYQEDERWLKLRIQNFDPEYENLRYSYQSLLCDFVKLLMDQHKLMPAVLTIKAYKDWMVALSENKNIEKASENLHQRVREFFTNLLSEIDHNPFERELMLEARKVIQQLAIKRDEANLSLAAWNQIKPLLKNGLALPV